MSIPIQNRSINLVNPDKWTQNYQELLLRIANSKVNDYQIAEDLVQDTFLSAWRGLANFRGDCSEKTYLSGILRNKIIDFYRARGRKPTVIASQIQPNNLDDDEGSWLEAQADKNSESDPSLAAARRDFTQALDKAVRKLPEKMAQAFRLWMIEDLSTSEVTKQLGITESNLWVSIHRAKKMLKAELGDNWNASSLSRD